MPRFLVVLSCLLVAVAGGCARRQSVIERATRDGVLHQSTGAEPADLDPQTVTSTNDARIIHALFDPLVSYEPGTLKPVPALAESWEISADGLTYVFHLRANARWSNGDAFTAEDVVASWRRVLTPALGAEYAYFLYLLRGAEAFHKGNTTDFATVGVTARDAHTLVVTLAHPAPYFLQVLLNSPWRPVHLRSIAAAGDPYRRGTAWTRPGALVSSGPFVLKEWSLNKRVVVEKSPTYWDRDRVRLTAIHFYPFDNSDAEERAFRAGQLHATWALPLAKVLPLQRERSPALRTDPLLETFFFRLNVRQAPLGDVRVRRALALALDRDSLANRILPGGRQSATTLVPPLLPGYRPPQRPGFDPAAARQLLAEAGHPGAEGCRRSRFSTTTPKSCGWSVKPFNRCGGANSGSTCGSRIRRKRRSMRAAAPAISSSCWGAGRLTTSMRRPSSICGAAIQATTRPAGPILRMTRSPFAPKT